LIRISDWTLRQKIAVLAFVIIFLGPGFWLGLKNLPVAFSIAWGVLIGCVPFIQSASGTRMVYRLNAENFKGALVIFVLVQVAYFIGLVV
jgi:hypothetical protein